MRTDRNRDTDECMLHTLRLQGLFRQGLLQEHGGPGGHYGRLMMASIRSLGDGLGMEVGADH